MDEEGRFCALFYISFYKGFEHPRILVSVGGPGINPQQIPGGYSKVLGELKVIHGFLTAQGLVPLTLVLFKCQL